MSESVIPTSDELYFKFHFTSYRYPAENLQEKGNFFTLNFLILLNFVILRSKKVVNYICGAAIMNEF